jgi:hypothetical protein
MATEPTACRRDLMAYETYLAVLHHLDAMDPVKLKYVARDLALYLLDPAFADVRRDPARLLRMTGSMSSGVISRGVHELLVLVHADIEAQSKEAP